MSESSSPPTVGEARAALDAIQSTQADVARKMVLPRGYDTLYAGAVAGMVVGIALLNAPGHGTATFLVGGAIVLVCTGVFGGLITSFKRANGYWIAGTTPRKARWVAVAAGVDVGIFVFLGSLAGSSGAWGLTAACAVAAFVIAFALNRLWMRVYRAEMQAD